MTEITFPHTNPTNLKFMLFVGKERSGPNATTSRLTPTKYHFNFYHPHKLNHHYNKNRDGQENNNSPLTICGRKKL